MIGQTTPHPESEPEDAALPAEPSAQETVPAEIGGRGGLDPVRYGDWEKNGRCIDF
ncbi:DUF1674 domain-containing protein [Stenotrophomonas panacihumi]|uniref:DUF1674 domain-containing protein n=1 Tax=Stenotrophomonas panacihumi TaxID=676599 RepID=UPI0009D7414C|nr:DUF1674 domain-containing protein [Stenotrophomonas panacihumi]PTN55887.1 DUF1674 domain-containing protein [Stenotrophomonas panacihumi]